MHCSVLITCISFLTQIHKSHFCLSSAQWINFASNERHHIKLGFLCLLAAEVTLFPNVAQMIEIAQWLLRALWGLFTLSHVAALSGVVQKTRLTGWKRAREGDVSELCGRCRWDYIEAACEQLRLSVVEGKVDIFRAVCAGCLSAPE